MGILTEEEIFVAAIEKPHAERVSFLDQACGGDDSLRAQLEALLAAHDHPDSLLELPACNATIESPVRVIESAGTIIGPYKLLQQIGEGGMGVVYMAEQKEPVERRVALKIIKPGMDTRQIIARFEAERQALAMMDHPNIAKVLDAGATDSGRPYFVMELVKGVPITQYCDELRLTPKQRLELFLPVLEAVQHAHQKGIIHRDIKPSNVLVADYDDRPVPKVIDFGVAKATSQKLTEKTMFTEFGQLVGTLDYMSPEQAKLNQMDIDTRSDIYSLGVLLYELLTGDTPFDRTRLRSAAFEEMMRIIREEEPPKPSTRLSASAMLASVSANRNTEPRKLSTLVRGELDWIVMKALDKDRGRRYETANGFLADLQRYLDNEPVQACPPSTAYKFRKFVHRNGVAIATTTLIIAVLVSATIISTWQAVRTTQALRSEAAAHRDADAARTKEAAQLVIADRRRIEADEQRGEADRQRRQAEINLRKAREAVDLMLTRVSEERLLQVPRMELLRRDLLENALRFYEGFLLQPGADSEVQLEAARCFRRLGSVRYHVNENGNEAATAYRKSIDILEEVLSHSPANQSECEAELSESYQSLGHLQTWSFAKYRDAETSYRKALALREKFATEHPDSLEARREVARVLRPLATALRNDGRPEEAEQALHRSLEIAQELVADSPAASTADHFTLAHSHYFLAQHLANMKQTTEAETEFRVAIDTFESLVAAQPDWEWGRYTLGETIGSLAILFHKSNRSQEAESAYQRCLSHFERLTNDFPHFPEYRRRLAETQLKLGQLLLSCERPDDAEQFCRQALETCKDGIIVAPDIHLWWIANGSQQELSTLLTSSGRSNEVEMIDREVIALGDRLVLTFPERTDLRIQVTAAHTRLAELLKVTDRLQEAEQQYRLVQPILEKLAIEFPDEPEHSKRLALNYNKLAQLLTTIPELHIREDSQALELAKKAIDLEPQQASYWNTLGAAHYRAGNYREAVTAFEKSISINADQPEQARNPSVDTFFLAMAHWQLNDKDEAHTWFDQAVAWMEQNQPEDLELLRFRQEAAELLGVAEPTNKNETSSAP